MALITKKGLAASPKRKTEDVPLEGLGGEVRLRAMSVSEALRLRKEVGVGRGNEDDPEKEAALTARMVARTWVDGNGARFWEDEEEGAAFVLELSANDFRALAVAVLRLSGVSPAEIEEAEKN